MFVAEGEANSEEAVMAPFQYICALPSKGVREKLVDALNVWIEAAPEELPAVASIVADVHNLSLMWVVFRCGAKSRS